MNSMFKLFFVPFFSILYTVASAQIIPSVPAPDQIKSILIKGGIIHTGTGEVIENGAVGFKAGKITEVVNLYIKPINEAEYDEVINVSGKHIYPGFIAPNSTLGLREIDAVRSTRDFSETGSMNPNVRSLIAYNTDSRIISTLKNNGVLVAQITPRFGLFPVLHLLLNLMPGIGKMQFIKKMMVFI